MSRRYHSQVITHTSNVGRLCRICGERVSSAFCDQTFLGNMHTSEAGVPYYNGHVPDVGEQEADKVIQFVRMTPAPNFSHSSRAYVLRSPIYEDGHQNGKTARDPYLDRFLRLPSSPRLDGRTNHNS
jgi:hypothetical protein